MKRLITVLALMVGLATAGMPADASSAEDRGEKSPEEMVRDGLEKILSALELFLSNIPQYHAPEILDNGDILIRRKRPGEEEDGPGDKTPDSDEEESPEFEETRT